MSAIVNTLPSSRLSTATRLGLPYVPAKYTTVNEGLSIATTETLRPGQVPTMGCFMVGIGGHTTTVGVGGIPITDPLKHNGKHAGLFIPMPFVLRDRANDLTKEQRTRYALRREETHGGRNYYAYYGRRLDLSGVTVRDKRAWYDDAGNRQVEDYIPVQEDLKPVPDSLSSTGTNTTSGESYYSSALMRIVFSENDVREFLNVAKIIYGDERYGIISEIAFCTNSDATVSIPTPSGNDNFLEAIVCQIVSFVTAKYELIYAKKGFDFTAELGSIEPIVGAMTIADDPVP